MITGMGWLGWNWFSVAVPNWICRGDRFTPTVKVSKMPELLGVVP